MQLLKPRWWGLHRRRGLCILACWPSPRPSPDFAREIWIWPWPAVSISASILLKWSDFSKTGALTPGEMTVYDRRAKRIHPRRRVWFCCFKALYRRAAGRQRHLCRSAGWGISSDGSNAAITAPSVPGQSLALKRAYKNADYGIEKLNFIEGHGTGTAVGDRVELEAIAALTREGSGEQKTI